MEETKVEAGSNKIANEEYRKLLVKKNADILITNKNYEAKAREIND